MIEPSMFLPSLSEIDTSEQIFVMGEAVGPRKIYYRLGESEIFTFANQNTKIHGEKMIDVIPKMVLSDQGFLHIEYSQLDKTVQYELFEGPRYKLACRKSIRELIDTGRIQMVYSETYKIPTCIPYIMQGTGPTCKAFVNVSDFLTLDQYGKYQISLPRNYNALMSIIFAAAVAVRVMETSGPVPADLADGMVLVHSAMLTRAINSLVHMDQVMKDKIAYITTEFALIQMYGTEQGQRMFLTRYATKYFPRLTKMITDTIDAQFQLDSFDNLSRLCMEMERNYQSLRGLDSYKVMDKWIRLYGAATTMSIDYLGYHLYTICMVLFESPLISRMALEPVMEKNKGLEMYRRMQTIIGNQYPLGR
ncbi:MAG: hypothetical protein K2F99_06225, partial [Muribaculaceae bacterium]|nr:hypothetical protein [Muribaculaceae bacterium]